MSYTEPKKAPFLNNIERRKADLLAARSKVQVGIRTIIFSVVSIGVAILLDVAIAGVVASDLERMRDETHEAIHAKAPILEGEPQRGGVLTFTNDGHSDIYVHSISCVTNRVKMKLGGGFGPGLAFEASLKVPSILRGGGDGQAVLCPNQKSLIMPPNDYITCADMTWSLNYSLLDDPKMMQTKAFRYVLPQGRDDWRQVPLASPIVACP